MQIKKKAWTPSFKAIKIGSKKFDLRLADWKCKPGDTLVLEEWNPKTKKYTGRTLKKRVSYVVKTKDWEVWPKKDITKYGFQIIGFK